MISANSPCLRAICLLLAYVSTTPARVFFFGREILRSQGVPVGLVVTAVGGTFIAQWMDPATLAADPVLSRNGDAVGRAGRGSGGEYSRMRPALEAREEPSP